MIATIWRLSVPTVSIAAFERAYASAGDRPRFFARAAGDARAELMRLAGEDGIQVTIDRWDTEADSRPALLADDYVALDRRCEAHTSEETWLGLPTLID